MKKLILTVWMLYLSGCGSSNSQIDSIVPANSPTVNEVPDGPSVPKDDVNHYIGIAITDQTNSDPQIVELMSYLSAHHVHGCRDCHYNVDQLVAKVEAGETIIVTCSVISEVAKQILINNNYQARLVTTLTLDNWTTNDNGHTMIEVYDNSLAKWTLFDLDNKVQPLINGKAITSQDFPAAIKNNSYTTFVLSTNDYFDTEDSDFETLYKNYELKSFYQRDVQVAMVQYYSDDNYYFITTGATDGRIESYAPGHIFALTKTTFNSLFY